MTPDDDASPINDAAQPDDSEVPQPPPLPPGSKSPEDYLLDEWLTLEHTDHHPDFRAGYVAFIGKANVGKSTQKNGLLDEKVAIISPKPQTTREKQLGILTTEQAQIIFVDTPGIHLPRTKLGDYMVASAQSAIPDADVLLFLVDVSEVPNAADIAIAERVEQAAQRPETIAILVLNKADLLDEDNQTSLIASYTDLVPNAEPLLMSAKSCDKCDTLLEMIIAGLPHGPRYYPAAQLTDSAERENAAEMIREQALILLEKEVPHSIAVQVEEYKQRKKGTLYIRAVIYVERDSQKGIVLGKGGAMLKQIGAAAREELQTILGQKVYLDLWVKVLKNWRKDPDALRRLGYN
ncbi:MAG: GTPase Era [Chloroflexi bacterium]|nr:GTPase Era [Chloroflexota bacterium]